MPLVGQYYKFKLFTGTDQSIHHLESCRRIDIIVQFPQDQHQFPLQTISIHRIGAFFIFFSDGIPHPLFIPPDLIHPVIMATASSDTHFIKIRVEQYSSHRILSACRAAINPNPVDIHLRIFSRRSLHPGDPVGKASVFQVFPTYIMEFFRTVSRPHSVDLYHDKAQLRQSGIYRRYGERFRDKRIVWSGIDILDYGIFFGRVEIYRTDDNSPNIGFSVSSFSTKHFRHSPPFCQHLADIGLFQRQRKAATGGQSIRDQLSVK